VEGIDTTKRFVRVTGHRQDRIGEDYVEFEFAVGEPELFVEMILPATAFEDFCSLNDVEHLPAAAHTVAAHGADDPWNWRLHDATDAVTRTAPDQASERP
jgi:phenol/toluene 2-monooxygenase (NADH) P0/A0